MVKSEALHERVEVLLDKWGIKPNKYLKFVFFLMGNLLSKCYLCVTQWSTIRMDTNINTIIIAEPFSYNKTTLPDF